MIVASRPGGPSALIQFPWQLQDYLGPGIMPTSPAVPNVKKTAAQPSTPTAHESVNALIQSLTQAVSPLANTSLQAQGMGKTAILPGTQSSPFAQGIQIKGQGSSLYPATFGRIGLY